MNAKTKIENEKHKKTNVKYFNRKNRWPILAGSLFACLGISILMASFLFESTILSFIGITITLWSTLLLLVRSTKSVHSALLAPAIISSLQCLDQFIDGLNVNGNAIYFAPALMKDFKSGKVLIPLATTNFLPDSVGKNQAITHNSNGVYLPTLGGEIANIFEESVEKSFAELSLNRLIEILPKIFVTKFELASDLNISHDENLIKIKISGIAFDQIYDNLYFDSKIIKIMGCPFTSAIICSVTRATGKNVMLCESNFSTKQKTITLQCKLLEG